MNNPENNIEIIGHLVDEPRLGPTKEGRPVCDMRVLVHNGRYPSFHIRVSVFDSPAHFCVEHLSQGDKVRVRGELRFRTWRDRARKFHEEFSIVGLVRPLAEGLSAQASPAAIPARLPTRAERRRLIRARARLRASVPTATYKLWFRPLRLGGITADAVHLVAPEHIRAWVERRYSSLIAGALHEESLPGVSFAAVVAGPRSARRADGNGAVPSPSRV